MHGRRAALVLAAVAIGAAAPFAVSPATRGWAFIAPATLERPVRDARLLRSRPGSPITFSDAAIGDMGHAVDWFPAAHAAPPPAVAGRGGGIYACGYCHLAAGDGRVENASLAGLPADYIREQVAAFATGSRRSAVADYPPSRYMAEVAKAVAPADLAAAADYFAAARFTSHVRVVEAAEVPATVPGRFVLDRAGSGTEPIDGRIVELPDDVEAFELRDPRVTYTAYVPPGSLARGAALTRRIGCPACHGAGMKVWGAGRSPTYIVRQLIGFRTGARHDPGSAPMRAVAAKLTQDDMVAVAAYWGSLKP